MRILVVDDEAIIRSLLRDVLTDDGHQVAAAENGRQAIDMVKESRFDVVLSDVHMPVLNGLEAVKAIKELDRSIFIVMMDSFPDLLSEMARGEGAITCIHKPFELKGIREVLERVKHLKEEQEVPA